MTTTKRRPEVRKWCDVELCGEDATLGMKVRMQEVFVGLDLCERHFDLLSPHYHWLHGMPEVERST